MKKCAIVTGSSSGVGAATALMLSQSGWNVLVNYHRNADGAEMVAARCREANADVLIFQGDVSDDSVCRSMVTAVIDRWGRIDGLVNNAGDTRYCPLTDLEGINAVDFLDLYSTNVISAFQMTRAASPALKQARGSVVNVSSIAGLNGNGSSMAYACSKGAMITLTLSLAHALAPDVRVNCICPGLIHGRWARNYLGDRYDIITENFAKASTLDRIATPEDIAEGIVHFVTEAKMSTGEIRTIDGGFTHFVTKLG